MKNVVRLLQRLRAEIDMGDSYGHLFALAQECMRDRRSYENPAAMIAWPIGVAKIFAMCIYNSKVLVEEIRRNGNKASEFQDFIGRARYKSLTSSFDDHFPNIIDLRHAIAHDAERVADEYGKHHDLEGGGVFVGFELAGNVLSGQWKGRMHSCVINKQTVQVLRSIHDQYFMAIGEFYDSKPKLAHPLLHQQ